MRNLSRLLFKDTIFFLFKLFFLKKTYIKQNFSPLHTNTINIFPPTFSFNVSHVSHSNSTVINPTWTDNLKQIIFHKLFSKLLCYPTLAASTLDSDIRICILKSQTIYILKTQGKGSKLYISAFAFHVDHSNSPVFHLT